MDFFLSFQGSVLENNATIKDFVRTKMRNVQGKWYLENFLKHLKNQIDMYVNANKITGR